jgi:methylenetetrahydrofolate dehydrogenase (NADP+)/methenyltetrahydrofolate cyclohydrolase
MKLVDGKKIADKILGELTQSLGALSFQPVLVDVLIGNDMVSDLYVKIKQKRAEEAGIRFELRKYSDTEPSENIYADIRACCARPEVCGVIIQLPVPRNFDKIKLLQCIDSRVDVDCLTAENLEKFYQNEPVLPPPTVAAIEQIFTDCQIDLAHKKILVIGQGELVGRPLTYVLKKKNYEVFTADRSTKNLSDLCFHSDVIVSAAGHPKLINGKMIKKGVIILDAGTADSSGGIVGDVDNDSVKDAVSLLAPVPGGVGPVTVAMLLKNVVAVAQSKKNN